MQSKAFSASAEKFPPMLHKHPIFTQCAIYLISAVATSILMSFYCVNTRLEQHMHLPGHFLCRDAGVLVDDLILSIASCAPAIFALELSLFKYWGLGGFAHRRLIVGTAVTTLLVCVIVFMVLPNIQFALLEFNRSPDAMGAYAAFSPLLWTDDIPTIRGVLNICSCLTTLPATVLGALIAFAPNMGSSKKVLLKR
jgi:hypothetical protein